MSYKGGLLPLPENKKPYQLGALVANLPKPESVPNFKIQNPWAEEGSQEDDDCSAWMVIAIAEAYWGRKFSRKFQFAMSKARTGNPEEWGQNLDDAMMVGVKVGFLPIEMEPKEMTDAPLSVTRYLSNWPNLEELVDACTPYKMKGMMEANGQYDAFDSALSLMYHFYNKGEKRLVAFGTQVDFSPNNKVVTGEVTGGFGHAMGVEGKENPYACIQGSWDGVDEYLFDRARYNSSVKIYGHFVYVPYTPEDMKWMQENKLKYGENNLAIRILFRPIYALIADLLKLIKSGNVGGVPSRWLLPAIIWQESSGNDNAIGDNGMAFGAMQIWQSYMSDVYPFRKATECLGNRKLSIDTFQGYMKRYVTEKRIGRPVTDEDIARCHNAGPNGYKKQVAIPYWWAVRAKMKKLEEGNVDPKLLERITRLS